MTPMPAGELRVKREWLGLSTPVLARLLDVREDTVRRWETGRDRIPHRVRDELASIETQTDADVEALATSLRKDRDAVVVVYRDSEDLPADRLAQYGAPWWRHVVARAVREVPGVAVCYPDEVEAVRESAL